MTQESFDTARHDAAEAEWLDYDLGDYQSEGQDGWEWAAPGDEFSRRIYVCADGDGPSMLAVFRVRFVVGTAAVAEAHASLDGCDIGCRGTRSDEAESQA